MSTWDTWDRGCTKEPKQTETDDEFTKNTIDSDQQKLVQTIQNVFLSDTQIHKTEKNNDDDDDDEGGGGASGGSDYDYPLRPYAEDCAYYMKTGTCKFKSACKFNHPPERANQAVNEKEASVEQACDIECKFYLTTGGCRFGEACKFKHSRDQDTMETADLNFLGLPIRSGEKECQYYMRTGSCAYGVKCKFHHPDPTDTGAADPEKASQDGSLGKVTDSQEDHAGEPPDPLPVSVESQPPTSGPWAPHLITGKTALHLENPACSLPVAVVSSEEKLSGHQMQTPKEVTEQTALNTQVNDSLEKNDGPSYNLCPKEEIEQKTPKVQVNVSLEKNDGPMPSLSGVLVEEFPERPGQLVCDYYMKTGDCKFRSTCKYHHPKTRSSQLHTDAPKSRDLNQKSVNELENIRQTDPAPQGDKLLDNVNASTHRQQRQLGEFPERPGQPECTYFVKTGDCKYRSACRYHHPSDRHPTACLLNDKGLPLRPGSEVCNHFKRYGICKLGRRCSFDHPQDLRLFNSSGGSTPHNLPHASGSSTQGNNSKK